MTIQTASLVNHLYSRSVNGQPVAEVGMGATILAWTDRYAATVAEVLKVGKSTIIRTTRDRAKRTDALGMSDCQTYSYETDPAGCSDFFRLGKSGKWAQVHRNPETGRWVNADCYGLLLGRRDHHHDFSF